MSIEIKMSRELHGELFQWLEQLTRSFAQLVTLDKSDALEAIDARMKAGVILELSVSFGSAGALCAILQGRLPDGSVHELITIDAPPSDTPFRLSL